MRAVFPALAATAALVLTPSSTAIAQANGLAAVSAHLKSVTTMTANFSQTDRAGKTVTGTLSLKRPGKVRFQYQKGVPILIVGDGKALTFIDYSVRQVQRWPIGSTPLGVLLNPNRDLTGIAKILPAANPNITLVEARDRKHPEYGVLTLAFTKNDSAPAGLMLEGWVSIDSQNNRTTVRLSNQRFNAPISDKTFIWSDPRPKGPRG